VICFLESSLSSGECNVARSTCFACSLSLVLSIAACSSLAASSRMPWSTGFSSDSVFSSLVEVTDANSRASDSLK